MPFQKIHLNSMCYSSIWAQSSMQRIASMYHIAGAVLGARYSGIDKAEVLPGITIQ